MKSFTKLFYKVMMPRLAFVVTDSAYDHDDSDDDHDDYDAKTHFN